MVFKSVPLFPPIIRNESPEGTEVAEMIGVGKSGPGVHSRDSRSRTSVEFRLDDSSNPPATTYLGLCPGGRMMPQE